MAVNTELADFLRSRRTALTPDDVGLPWGVEGRRVKGLRRAEVATLAGVSTDYYAKLEQGRVPQISEQVLHALAGALRLDVKRILHAVVGELELNYEAFASTADPGLTMIVYSAPPGSVSEERLKMLASWGHSRATIA